MLCKLYKNHLQVNAMQIKDQQKKKKRRILKIILTDFSRKEKAITRYTRIYIKLNGRDNTKQAKSFIFIVSLNKNSRNVVVSREEKIVIIILIVTKLIEITLK